MWSSAVAAIAYVWSMPLLGGLVVKGSTSISAFISTPGATGAMAVAFTGPLLTMLELEKTAPTSFGRSASFAAFLAGFGAFLIFSVVDNEIPHYIAVSVFATGFVVHASYRAFETRSAAGKAILGVGVLAFVALPILVFLDTGIYFWAVECIGFTAMVLFSPTELVFNA
jgi:hypothetical protein